MLHLLQVLVGLLWSKGVSGEKMCWQSMHLIWSWMWVPRMHALIVVVCWSGGVVMVLVVMCSGI